MDEFGHKVIAARLADAIADKRNTGSNVVGIVGPWGSGKSGILELLKIELTNQEAPPGDSYRHRVSVQRFDPWLIGSKPLLISAFFGQLLSAVDEIRQANLRPTEIDQRRWDKGLDALSKHLRALGESSSIVIGAASVFDPSGTTAVGAFVAGVTSKLLSSIKIASKSLEKQRMDVVAALDDVAAMRPGLRIVILIDDIDRLEPDEAVEVLRLVKAVAGFPYITYVLAYDRDILAHAVERGMQVSSGYGYLEKIVQFSFVVPPPEPGKLTTWLQSIIEKEFQGAGDLKSHRAAVVLSLWASRLLETPRDVKRLVAALRIMWPSLENKADFLDLVWLELLKEKASSNGRDLYGWVRNYLEATQMVAAGSQVVSPAESGKKLDAILTELGWSAGSDEDKSSSPDPHYLSTLLPGIHSIWRYGDNPTEVYDFKDEYHWRPYIADKRLGSPRHWRIYFGFDHPASAITDQQVAQLFNDAEHGWRQLETTLAGVLEDDKQGVGYLTDQLLFERLEPQIPRLRSDAARSWLIVLMRIPDLLVRYSAFDQIFGIEYKFVNRFRRISASLVRQIQSPNVSKLFEEIFEVDPAAWAVADYLRSELNYFHKAASGESLSEKERTLSDDEFVDVKLRALQFFEKMNWNDVGAAVGPWNIMYAWKHLGGEVESHSWLSEKLSDDNVLCDRLEKLVTHSYSSASSEPIQHLKQDYLQDFTDAVDIKRRLERISSSPNSDAARAAQLLDIWDTEKR
tara:strand:+ start:3990 stop:6215 length:2226 start_codon:yes stop_codon:yes gene_type:complete